MGITCKKTLDTKFNRTMDKLEYKLKKEAENAKHRTAEVKPESKKK